MAMRGAGGQFAIKFAFRLRPNRAIIKPVKYQMCLYEIWPPDMMEFQAVTRPQSKG
jgi:hypothetical protein